MSQYVIGRSNIAIEHNGKLMGLELPYMYLKKIALYESGLKQYYGIHVWNFGETAYLSSPYGEQFVFNDSKEAFDNIEWKRDVDEPLRHGVH